MDLTESIAPASDQLDACDLLTGPRTFTITGVSKGNAEQPVQFQLAEFPRVWRPGKSMRRVLVASWGADATAYIGRRITLYCDPDVIFGKEKVGGTRISHLSHLDKPKAVPLLISRGKSAIFTVNPLPDAPSEPTAQQVAECTDPAILRGMWQASGSERKAQIAARKAALEAQAAAEPQGPMIPERTET